MNRIIPIALLFAMSAILGCESTPHYNRTKIVVTGAALPKKPYGTVKLFQSNSEVTSNYDVIALMSVEGSPGDESAFIKAFLYRAADVGADAIILHRGTVEMPEWGRKFIEMINNRKPITYDVYTMPNLSNQIRTELERNCYCRYNLRGTDRFFLISNPIRSQTQ